MNGLYEWALGVALGGLVLAGVAGAFGASAPRAVSAGSAAQAATATPTPFPTCTPRPTGTLPPTATPTPNIVPNQYLVLLNAPGGDPSVFQLAQAIADQYGIPVLGVAEFGPVFATQMSPDRVAAVSADPRVFAVIQDEFLLPFGPYVVTCL